MADQKFLQQDIYGSKQHDKDDIFVILKFSKDDVSTSFLRVGFRHRQVTMTSRQRCVGGGDNRSCQVLLALPVAIVRGSK